METLWFILLAFMVTTWVVLDGFDFGAGILHLFVARNQSEREAVIESVGPVWDGNEVWLVAAGAAMLMAFPTLLGVAFSGFYLPLMIVLWLLVFRALGIELRHQLHDRLWTHFWDLAFAASSVLLTVFVGAALANVFRGVPLDDSGVFFEPLWTDFRVGDETGILDWYTVLVGVTAAVALSHHGALWLIATTDGMVADRAGRAASGLWPSVLGLTVLVAVASVVVQPNAADSFAARPWIAIFPVAAVGGHVAALLLRRAERRRLALAASSVYLYGSIGGGAACLYPFVLPARDPALGLTVEAAAAPASSLSTALLWWIPGMVLVIGYFVFMYRRVLR